MTVDLEYLRLVSQLIVDAVGTSNHCGVTVLVHDGDLKQVVVSSTLQSRVEVQRVLTRALYPDANAIAKG